ncbi:MAG: ABC transporter permease [Phycisphaerales bacterium]|nr:ABC transporter permease [Phycisphaerales bacterium]
MLRFLPQSIMLALSQIWVNKGRAILTSLGIIIGVASVTAVIAGMTGLKTHVLDQFADFGANKVYVFPRNSREAREAGYSYHDIRMNMDEVDGMLDKCPSLARLTPMGEFYTPVSYGERSQSNVMVTGMRPDWHRIEGRSVIEGREFLPIDEQAKRQVCIVNDKAIDELRLPRTVVGEYLLVGGRRFQIVGVVETKEVGALFGGDRAETEIFIPHSTAWKMREPGLYVIAQTSSPDVTEEARAEIEFFMRQARGLHADDPDTFGVEFIEQYVEQFKQMAKVMTGVAMGIVGVSLLVGGIGIMNIMLVSVSERTREIGLRKAVGARPGVVLFQFLIEAITLCCVGGAVGVLLGQGLTLLISRGGGGLQDAYIPPWAIVMAFGFSAFVGVAFGMFPAIKAARLDPIEALRHE